MRAAPRAEMDEHVQYQTSPGGQTVAARIEHAIASLPPAGVTVAELRHLVGAEGLMLLTAFLTLVFIVPVSIPGVSTVFGGAILLIGLSRVMGRELWLPAIVERKVVSTEKLRGAMARGLVWLRRLERLSRPHRVPWATTAAVARVANDCALVLGAVLLMAPFGLIPLSNTLPAVALLFFAIGILQRDGVCVLIGHTANLATIAYFALLIGGGGVAIRTALTHFFAR